MPNIKSVGLSKKYKNYRKRRIIYMRDVAEESVPWNAIAERFGITTGTAQNIYKRAKDEQKEGKKEQT